MALSTDEAPSERTDESGVAGGVTVLVLAVPLLLLSALAFYSGRLAQADNHLSWAATSAARAGAHCRIPVSDAEGRAAGNAAASQAANNQANRPCSLREAALSIEKTVRAILLENRRLYCQNSNSTGMRVEYQDQDGDLIYAYVIGSLLLNGRYWPDRGGEIRPPGEPEFDTGEVENIGDSTNFDPFQARNLRKDFNGNALFLESSEGLVDETVITPGNDGPLGYIPAITDPNRASNPSEFDDLTVGYPIDSSGGAGTTTGGAIIPARTATASRITVHLICDFVGAATNLLSRASTREASATAVVPVVFPAEAV